MSGDGHTHGTTPPGWRRTQVALLALGLAVSGVLLIRLAFDVRRLGVGWSVAAFLVAGCLLALGILGTVALARGREDPEAVGRLQRGLLLGVIPLSLLIASWDCTGLAFRGCETICHLQIVIGLPVTALLAGALFFAPRRSGLLAGLTGWLLLFAIPNCSCYNPVNGWWIDRLGLSPACFALGLGVSFVALAALASGRRVRTTLVLTWLVVVGMLGFFIGHHYFSFPW